MAIFKKRGVDTLERSFSAPLFISKPALSATYKIFVQEDYFIDQVSTEEFLKVLEDECKRFTKAVGHGQGFHDAVIARKTPYSIDRYILESTDERLNHKTHTFRGDREADTSIFMNANFYAGFMSRHSLKKEALVLNKLLVLKYRRDSDGSVNFYSGVVREVYKNHFILETPRGFRNFSYEKVETAWLNKNSSATPSPLREIVLTMNKVNDNRMGYHLEMNQVKF